MQKCSQGRGSSRMTVKREGGEPTANSVHTEQKKSRALTEVVVSADWFPQSTVLPPPFYLKAYFGRCLKCLEILSWRSLVGKG